MVEIPCKDKARPKGRTTARVPVVLPHELLIFLWETGRCYIHPSVIKEFWERWGHYRPSYHEHAAALKCHTPLALCGDDAKYTLGGAKVIVIAMSLVILDRANSKGLNDMTSRFFNWLSIFVGEPYGVVIIN